MMMEGNINLDQRLEALTQSVEMLASMHKDNEKRIAAGEERTVRMSAALEQLITVSGHINERIARAEGMIVNLAEGTVRLLHAVESHEERITELEQNRNPQ